MLCGFGWRPLRHSLWFGIKIKQADCPLAGLAEAVAIYTIGGARALSLGDRTGSIETGKLTDLIILDQNIIEISIEDIGSTQFIELISKGS